MSQCPVNNNDSNPAKAQASQSSWSRWLSSSSSSPANNINNDTPQQPQTTVPASSACPVVKGGDDSPSTVVASVEEAAQHAQTPQPDQRMTLGQVRQVSSIPRGDATSTTTSSASTPVAAAPHHQHDPAATHWVYPSEQQLYNAMRRKGWQNIPEESIPMVLQIHNGINEGTWSKVQQWEGGNDDVRLVRFQGRPRDLTPKAYVLSRILGWYPQPFDRHDWYVEDPVRRPGELQRYVIDYYMMEQRDPASPPRPHVDARPAWEGPRGVTLRATRLLQEAFPGITAYWKRYTQQQQQQPPRIDKQDG